MGIPMPCGDGRFHAITSDAQGHGRDLKSKRSRTQVEYHQELRVCNAFPAEGAFQVVPRQEDIARV